MRRFRVPAFITACLLLDVIPNSRLDAAPLSTDSARGAHLFETLSCIQCHRINGKGGTGASDLGWRIGRNFTPATLAAAMWNQAPEMWTAMRERSVVPADLDCQAAADLFAYFYAVGFFEKPGDAGRGKAAFESKGCSKCHRIGPAKLSGVNPVSQWESVSEPIALASAMWNHGAPMAAESAKSNVKWPQLTSQDLTDLVIYLQGQQPRASERIEITSGAEGAVLFHSKGCDGCHTEGLALAERLKRKTLTDIAAAMWNHKPRMANNAPQLTAGEMGEIASYLWATGFFEDSGNAAAGGRVFSAKHCDACHNASSGVPELNGKACSAIAMVSALWHHGPEMLDQMKAKGIPWPRFEGAEMSNLIAFLNLQQ